MPSYSTTYRAMGSPFSIRIDCKEPEPRTSELFTMLQDHTEELEQILSRFRTNSELTALNRCVGEVSQVSNALASVLSLADQMHRLTTGAFTPYVLTSLHNIGYIGAPVSQGTPSRREQSSLFEWVSAHQIRIQAPVDLGGIGKGYTADVLSSLIENFLDPDSLTGYIVDAGGDIVLRGGQENGEPWSIGVENPFQPDTLAAALGFPPTADRTAVCTSSLQRKSWLHNGDVVHHMIDPQTGSSLTTELMASTAIGISAARTEVFTKFLFFQHAQRDYRWLGESLPFLAMTKNREFTCSPDMVPLLTWLSPGVTVV
jgi:thiamine biosynthesis lipoprotein